MRTDKILVLIWIQTVWYSGSRFYSWKIVLKRLILKKVCKRQQVHAKKNTQHGKIEIQFRTLDACQKKNIDSPDSDQTASGEVVWSGSSLFAILTVILWIPAVKTKIFRTLVTSAWRKFNFLISQPKHMLWVLKRIVSMRRFFWAPKTYVNWWVRKYLHFTLKFFVYLNLWF